MQKNETNFAPCVNFTEQTPKAFIEQIKFDPLYEQAFLSHDDRIKSEFAQNTAAWD